MCGIVFSIINDTYAQHTEEFFKDAMLASQVRGIDSSGLFQIDKKGQLFTYKQAMHASDFLVMKQAENIVRDVPRCPLTVGHVRHATAGSVNDKNAHPFVTQHPNGLNVVGVHNGTLRGWKDKPGGTEEEVDSAWAFNILAEKGPTDAFKYFNGAYAFVWYDELYPDHVFMARNDDRPLHYFVSEDKKVMLGASELGMLGWLVEKHGFKLDRKSGSQLYYLAPDKLYKFSLKNIGQCEITDRVKYDPTTTIPKPTPPPSPANTSMTAYDRSRAAYDYSEYGEYGYEYDDRLPWGGQGAVGWRNAQSARGEQATVLKAVKDALRDARNAPADSTVVADIPPTNDVPALPAPVADARMEAGIKEAIQNFTREKKKDDIDPWDFVGQDMFVGSPVDKSCTSEEIKAARDCRLYGRAVAFIGILWDDDTSDTWGEVQMMRNGQVITKDCIIRGATKSIAEARYINTAHPTVLTIVGAMEGVDDKQTIYLLSELTPEARKQLAGRTMRKAGVH